MRPWEDKTVKAGFLSSFTEAEARSWVLTQIEQELRSSLIRDRGLTAQKILPGTAGQAMVTGEENGVLYSEWGRVDPMLGIAPAYGAKIANVVGAYGQSQRVPDTSYEYSEMNTTVFNYGCTVDTSGTCIPAGGGVAVNPQNNYIRVPVAGLYDMAGSNLWYPPGANIRVGCGIYNQTTNVVLAMEYSHQLPGLNDVTVPVHTSAYLAAGDKISQLSYFYWGAGGFHVTAATADAAGRHNWLSVLYRGPAS